MTETCHNCGLPSDCCPSKGYKIQITRKADNEYCRESKRTVWCHSKECALQALAVAKYGPTTHRWPITLAQFRATHPLEGSEQKKSSSRMPIASVSEAAVAASR
jgi:hypothetical protein